MHGCTNSKHVYVFRQIAGKKEWKFRVEKTKKRQELFTETNTCATVYSSFHGQTTQ